jgi:hypothetical protein
MSVEAEFVIPLHHEDLEIKTEDSYCVGPKSRKLDLADDKAVEQALRSVASSLHADAASILQHDVFDPMYKMARFFDGLRDECKLQLSDALTSSLPALVSRISDLGAGANPDAVAEQVPPADCSSDLAEPSARAAEKNGSLNRRWRGGSQTPVLRNALKMCVFLLSWLGISAEKASIARPATQVPPRRLPCPSRPQSRGCVRMARFSRGCTFAADARRFAATALGCGPDLSLFPVARGERSRWRRRARARPRRTPRPGTGPLPLRTPQPHTLRRP